MKNKRSNFLGTEPINKLLTKLSIPAIIGMIFNAFYNLVDTIFVGRFVGANAIGGLAIAFPIQMLMIGTGIMIGIGTASAVSRSLGANQIDKADNYAGNSFLAVLIIGISFTLLGSIFLKPLLLLFGATENILPFSYEYLQTILFGAVFIIGTITANNLVRAEGNAKMAMITMIIGAVLNIILDFVFIKIYDLGIRGAAIATVISRMISFIFIISYFYIGKSSLAIKVKHLKLRFHLLKEIFSVGFPSFMRNIGNSILAIVLNNSLSFFGGDMAINVFGIINKLMLFCLMPMFGITQGFQPIAGFNFGAEKYSRLKQLIITTIKRLIIYGLGITLFIQIFTTHIIKLFTTNIDLINMGTYAIRFVYIFVPFIGVQLLTSVLFQSIGKAKPAFFLSFLRQILLLIPLTLIIPRLFNLGLTGIWLSFPIADFLAVIISGSMLLKQTKKINKLY